MPEHDEVHVWTAFVSEASAFIPAFELTLSGEEAKRAARFLRPEDRSRYVAARGILRQMLGRYLAEAPARLGLVAGPFGKPALASRAGQPLLEFNLAHTGDVIVFAVTIGRRVGVDTEAVRSDLDALALARSQFSEAEARVLEALPPAERTDAFFRCWTRKEAYVKARGEGLGFSLKQFSVSFGRDEPPGLQWVADDPSASGRWSVFDFPPAPGYAGAVVVEGRPARLAVRQWESSS
jgi:4'-phosphopantetheinyl transferase